MTLYSKSVWVTTATSFFVASTNVPITVRFTTQMMLLSSILWLGKVEVVSLGMWKYDDISKLRLLTTDTVDVPRFLAANKYMEQVPATNLMINSAAVSVNLSTAILYLNYT